ncbi:hypothetical protein RHECNPAF_1760055 [Rhizobium etli CNPAF512]|nr:hypothetical protein RHECNPAF_1760055 [Rhizobium etli CNPAF512]
MPSGMPYLAAADWISRSQAPVEAAASEVNAASPAAASPASRNVFNTGLACAIEASIRPLRRLIVALARRPALPLLGERLLLGGLPLPASLIAGVDALDGSHTDGNVVDRVTLAAQRFENLAVIFLQLPIGRAGFDLQVDVQGIAGQAHGRRHQAKIDRVHLDLQRIDHLAGARPFRRVGQSRARLHGARPFGIAGEGGGDGGGIGILRQADIAARFEDGDVFDIGLLRAVLRPGLIRTDVNIHRYATTVGAAEPEGSAVSGVGILRTWNPDVICLDAFDIAADGRQGVGCVAARFAVSRSLLVDRPGLPGRGGGELSGGRQGGGLLLQQAEYIGNAAVIVLAVGIRICCREVGLGVFDASGCLRGLVGGRILGIELTAIGRQLGLILCGLCSGLCTIGDCFRPHLGLRLQGGVAEIDQWLGAAAAADRVRQRRRVAVDHSLIWLRIVGRVVGGTAARFREHIGEVALLTGGVALSSPFGGFRGRSRIRTGGSARDAQIHHCSLPSCARRPSISSSLDRLVVTNALNEGSVSWLWPVDATPPGTGSGGAPGAPGCMAIAAAFSEVIS